MPKTKVALTIDADLLEQVDALVSQHRFRNRSQAIEAALADKRNSTLPKKNVSPMKAWRTRLTRGPNTER